MYHDYARGFLTRVRDPQGIFLQVVRICTKAMNDTKNHIHYIVHICYYESPLTHTARF